MASGYVLAYAVVATADPNFPTAHPWFHHGFVLVVGPALLYAVLNIMVAKQRAMQVIDDTALGIRCVQG